MTESPTLTTSYIVLPSTITDDEYREYRVLYKKTGKLLKFSEVQRLLDEYEKLAERTTCAKED